MGREIVFIVAGAARPEEKKTGRAFLSKAGNVVQPPRYESADRRDWKADVRKAAKAALNGPPMEGPIHLTLTFIKPPSNDAQRRWQRLANSLAKVTKADRWPWAWWQKPDENNLSKPVEDACKSVVWLDDAQIVGTEKWKIVGDCHETLIQVREVDLAEVEYKRAAAEGIICGLNGGCGRDTGGYDAEIVRGLVELPEDAHSAPQTP